MAMFEPLGSFDRSIDHPLPPTYCGQPELSVCGLLVPWIVIVGALGFLAAWLVVAIMERTGLSRHVWHLPLFFLALAVLFSAFLGMVFFP
jgi:hypothetical protein